MNRQQQPWKAVKKWVAPVLTVTTSALLLTVAAWVHRIETTSGKSFKDTGAATGTSGLTTTTIGSGTANTGASGATSPSQQLDVGMKNHSPSGNSAGSGSNASSNNNTQSATGSKQSTSHHSDGKTQPSHSAGQSSQSSNSSHLSSPPSTSTNAPTSDIGFGPVSGGKVATIAGAHPTQSTTLHSLVTQYGSHPLTTWTSASISGPNGVSLTILQGESPRDMLVLRLTDGVLWAVIPPTQFVDGVRGPSTRPTPLYYTPYPATGTSSLKQGATVIGIVPISAPLHTTDEWTGWYGPSKANLMAQSATSNSTFATKSPSNTANTSANAANGIATSNSTTSNSTTTNSTTTNSTATNSTATNSTATNSTATNSTATNSTATNSTATNSTATNSTATTSSTAANTTSNTVTSKTPQNQGPHLYLQGLYQTAVGAVIVLSVETPHPGTNKVWTYLWSERTQSLTPIASLTNGNGNYSWFAVGDHLVYWETRHLLPPTDIYFTGSQFLMNVDTKQVVPIHLGSWTSEAVSHGDNLDFRVQNTVTWETFIPDPVILSPGAKD